MAGNEDIVRILSPFENWKNGFVVLDGSVQQITSKNIAIREVTLRAKGTNTNDVDVGSSNLSSSNSTIRLKPNFTTTIKADNLSKIFILGTASDELNYSYVI